MSAARLRVCGESDGHDHGPLQETLRLYWDLGTRVESCSLRV